MVSSKNTTTNQKVSQRHSTSKKPVPQVPGDPLDPSQSEQWLSLIRERAYFKAQARGFVAGHELDDWCEAEKEQLAESGHSSIH